MDELEFVKELLARLPTRWDQALVPVSATQWPVVAHNACWRQWRAHRLRPDFGAGSLSGGLDTLADEIAVFKRSYLPPTPLCRGALFLGLRRFGTSATVLLSVTGAQTDNAIPLERTLPGGELLF
jgi:hypothetical protein